MRLDQTQVRIRERNVLEILDLSVQMLRVYWKPCLALTVLGALPFAILNYFLTFWMIDPVGSGFESPFIYLWSQVLLIGIEAPLASVLLTTYLGHAVFDEAPTINRIFRDAFRKMGMLVWTLVILRGAALLWWIDFVAVTDAGEFSTWRVLGTLLLVAWVLPLRCFRPFIVELIVLEQPKWRSRENNEPSLKQRSSQIHNAAAGTLLGRGLLFALVVVGMSWMVFGGIATIAGFANNDWFPGRVALGLVWPMSLWLLVGFMTIVRFLNYLDVRIRQEGWEVELLVRAEAIKLEESLV